MRQNGESAVMSSFNILTRTGKKLLGFVASPVTRQPVELLALEVQIFRLVCGILWVFTSIGLSLANISLEAKLLLLSFATLTVVDIMLRTLRVVEARKQSHPPKHSD